MCPLVSNSSFLFKMNSDNHIKREVLIITSFNFSSFVNLGKFCFVCFLNSLM